MKRIAVFTFLLLMIGSIFVMGEVQVKWKGLVQTWFSYTDQGAGDKSGLGFSLRTARINPYGSFSDKIKWSLQVAWDKQVAKILDVYLDFDIEKYFKIRVGQFSVPGTVSGSLTSSSKLDLIERPSIIENWGDKNSLVSHRGVGLQVHGDIIEKKLYYAVMIANPNAAELFSPSVKSGVYSHPYDGVMIWSRLEAAPIEGLRFGAFFGSGEERETDYCRSSYGANLFYVKAPYNFKMEYLAGKYGLKNQETKYSGMFFLFGYKVGKLEPIAQYDIYIPNDNNPDTLHVKKYQNMILGLNYFYNDNIKIQANFVIRNETMAVGFAKLVNNLFYICCQYSF